MNNTNAWRTGLLSLVITTAAGCGGGSNGAMPAGAPAAGAGADEYEVISPEEAKAAADREITNANADEAFETLNAEIEAELDDGG